MDSARITVCICTYRRLEQLTQLLQAVNEQQTDGCFTIACVVVDNEPSESARSVLTLNLSNLASPVRYAVEPARNLATVRNRACDLADGEFLAFIDDDELPQPDWLLCLWRTLNSSKADAVLGPVRPRFDVEPPKWIVRSRICERPSYTTGTQLHWRQTRTGNVLLRRSVIAADGIRFDPAYASGGEDVDFFRRSARAGKTVVWCQEAPVYEMVPAPRLRRSYYLRRALLQGRVSLRYATERATPLSLALVVGKALVAAGAYSLALPFLFLCGDHIGMKYLIKDCHHVSRLLAAFGFQHATERNF